MCSILADQSYLTTILEVPSSGRAQTTRSSAKAIIRRNLHKAIVAPDHDLVVILDRDTSMTKPMRRVVNNSDHELRKSSNPPFLVFTLMILPSLYFTLPPRTSSLEYRLARSLKELSDMMPRCVYASHL